MSEQSKLSRRAFLAATTTTAVVAASGKAFSDAPNTARVVPGKESPNEKLNVAAIGAGGKGLSDIMSFRRENVVALADPDWDRASEAFYRLSDAKQYKDYRKMLEEMPEIDAVTISTPDHSHAPAAYMAMKLGKHCYIQKPLTHTIAEARFLQAVAKETGVVTQMGNQGHCQDGVRELCEMIWSGAIGDVKEAHIWTNRPVWPQGIQEALPEEEIPSHIDWDLWLGPAPMRAYNKGYAPFNWRGWWDYGCGAIGDMACHIMDPAFWALKLYEAEGFSVEVVNEEGMNLQTAPLKSTIKFTVPARSNMPALEVYWYDGGNNRPPHPEGVPESQKLGDGNNGSYFVGSNGIATAGEYGGNPRLLPDEKMKDFTKPDPSIPRVQGESPYRDFLNAIKENGQAASHIDYAAPLTEMANFGNVALFAGKKLDWDSKAFKITNDADANQLLTKEYRAGWEMPLSDYVTIS